MWDCATLAFVQGSGAGLCVEWPQAQWECGEANAQGETDSKIRREQWARGGGTSASTADFP